ncbi:zinc finger protein 57 isoform X2 [Drosophila takahashii]|uniref:zinc finger protein 57 isoform X2 n=1 Tax=Drosophila takahashii TaxID=29030 RepID=UPI0038995195
MGRKSGKTVSRKPRVQRTIKAEEESNEVHIKTEDPDEETYPQTGIYEVVMLDAENQVKEEYALEDQEEDEQEPEEDEISYRLAGPPKFCSTCLKAFPIEEFPNHDCMNNINGLKEDEEISYRLAGPPKFCSTCLKAFPIDEFSFHICNKLPCKICPKKFRYQSQLIKHLRTHLRLQKGESIPELEVPKPKKYKTPPIKQNVQFNYSPTPRTKLSRRRAEMLKLSERRNRQKLCPYCPIAFTNESHLEKHLRNHHAELIYSNELITPDANSDSTEDICVKLENEETA